LSRGGRKCVKLSGFLARTLGNLGLYPMFIVRREGEFQHLQVILFQLTH